MVAESFFFFVIRWRLGFKKNIRRTFLFWLVASSLQAPEWPMAYIRPQKPLSELVKGQATLEKPKHVAEQAQVK